MKSNGVEKEEIRKTESLAVCEACQALHVITLSALEKRDTSIALDSLQRESFFFGGRGVVCLFVASHCLVWGGG